MVGRCGLFEFVSYVMRRIILSAFALSLCAIPALAKSPNLLACKAYASAVADEWASDQIVRASENDPLGSGNEVLVIAGGRSYYVARQPNEIIHKPVGQRVIERQQVFRQQLRRCLRGGGDITVQLERAAQAD
jgi:hypothetical protein